jgi:folate-binding protein YgfZ
MNYWYLTCIPQASHRLDYAQSVSSLSIIEKIYIFGNIMQQEWKDNLLDSGAEFDNEERVSFAYTEHESHEPNVLTHNILCDLSSIGLIRVQGEDATTFLQNQLTNDINQVSATKGQLSAWCTPKGRALATFVIHQHDDIYYLALSADKVEVTLKRLRMYVMMSKVVLEDVRQQLIHFAVAGSNITQHLHDYGIEQLPEADYQVVQHNTLRIMRLPSATPHFEVYANAADIADAKGLWNALNAQADIAPVSDNAWRYLNIVSGLPMVNAASSEAWIPQMLNLQVIDGVSFTKGCFPGQEIVARLKYLGKNKRRLYRLLLETEQLPDTGTLIIAEDEPTEAGKVLNAALNPDGQVEVLAVLKIAMAENKALYLAEQGGAAVTLLELPYAIDDE